MSSTTRAFCLALCLSIPALCSASEGASSTQIQVKTERRIKFTRDWRFFKGEAAGAEATEFTDSAWRTLDLPHDWAIEGPFDKKHDPNTGGLPISGTGWYRKHFALPVSAKERHLSIEFDGAMSNARVWLNGKELGSRPYGYASFAFDLTPNIRRDGDNVLAVRLAPEPQSSRWYPGAGIYRNVWLTVTGPVHVAHWGTYVTTPEVTATKATVVIATEIQNDGANEAAFELRASIEDAQNRTSALVLGSTILGVKLWSPRTPRWLIRRLSKSPTRIAGTWTTPTSTAS